MKLATDFVLLNRNRCIFKGSSDQDKLQYLLFVVNLYTLSELRFALYNLNKYIYFYYLLGIVKDIEMLVTLNALNIRLYRFELVATKWNPCTIAAL
jgi:hypothetical protein